MVSDTSTAKADVKVRVVLDLGTGAERVVEPGEVVYSRRSQTLSATLEGAIAGCLSVVTNLDGSLGIVLNQACVQPEVIDLILDTMDAASFNFVAVDVPQGVHTVSVQAQIKTSGTVQNGTFEVPGLSRGLALFQQRNEFSRDLGVGLFADAKNRIDSLPRGQGSGGMRH